MTSLICKYTSNLIAAKTTSLKVFLISLVNFIVNALNLWLSKFWRRRPQTLTVKVRSHSLSSCKNLLHTTFWHIQIFCSYSKPSCMTHRQFSIKICHSSCIYCNSVCLGDSKLRDLSLNHSVSSPLWVRALVGSNMRQKYLLQVRRGGFSWEYPVFTPLNYLALFEMREIILKGCKPKSWLKSFI